MERNGTTGHSPRAKPRGPTAEAAAACARGRRARRPRPGAALLASPSSGAKMQKLENTGLASRLGITDAMAAAASPRAAVCAVAVRASATTALRPASRDQSAAPGRPAVAQPARTRAHHRKPVPMALARSFRPAARAVRLAGLAAPARLMATVPKRLTDSERETLVPEGWSMVSRHGARPEAARIGAEAPRADPARRQVRCGRLTDTIAR